MPTIVNALTIPHPDGVMPSTAVVTAPENLLHWYLIPLAAAGSPKKRHHLLHIHIFKVSQLNCHLWLFVCKYCHRYPFNQTIGSSMNTVVASPLSQKNVTDPQIAAITAQSFNAIQCNVYASPELFLLLESLMAEHAQNCSQLVWNLPLIRKKSNTWSSVLYSIQPSIIKMVVQPTTIGKKPFDTSCGHNVQQSPCHSSTPSCINGRSDISLPQEEQSIWYNRGVQFGYDYCLFKVVLREANCLDPQS